MIEQKEKSDKSSEKTMVRLVFSDLNLRWWNRKTDVDDANNRSNHLFSTVNSLKFVDNVFSYGEMISLND